MISDEHKEHANQNVLDFAAKYRKKYYKGVEEHSGGMWEMGAYQFLENAEDEVLDLWSYLRGIRQCLDEINEMLGMRDGITYKNVTQDDVLSVLHRIKQDK